MKSHYPLLIYYEFKSIHKSEDWAEKLHTRLRDFKASRDENRIFRGKENDMVLFGENSDLV